MSVRASRLVQWGVIIALAVCCIFGGRFIENKFFTDKTPIKVYAPEDMEKAFKSALGDLKSQYKIEITDDSKNADICVEYGKENDETYTKFAFSPFVIAYGDDRSCFKKLEKGETIVQSEFDEELYEIDFLKVIDEVIGDGLWENLGLDKYNKIKLFYPDRSTDYWHDFYNFMLLTVNEGTYPKTDDEMRKAINKIKEFEDSDCTEAVVDFDEKIERTNGFKENSLYVIPEKTLYQLVYDHSKKTQMFFPLQTCNFNLYSKGFSENGKKVIHNIKYKFYSKLKDEEYRSSNVYELNKSCDSVKGERDVYQLVDIPKENFFTEDYSDEE